MTSITDRCSQHTSLAEASTCSTQVIQAYFVNGTLPEKGKVCEVNGKLFQKTAGAKVGSKREVHSDEGRLLRAAEEVSLAWSRRLWI